MLFVLKTPRKTLMTLVLFGQVPRLKIRNLFATIKQKIWIFANRLQTDWMSSEILTIRNGSSLRKYYPPSNLLNKKFKNRNLLY